MGAGKALPQPLPQDEATLAPERPAPRLLPVPRDGGHVRTEPRLEDFEADYSQVALNPQRDWTTVVDSNARTVANPCVDS